jgi:hypothetical protein
VKQELNSKYYLAETQASKRYGPPCYSVLRIGNKLHFIYCYFTAAVSEMCELSLRTPTSKSVYIFLVYVKTLSTNQIIWHFILEWLVNKFLRRLQKQTLVVNFEVCLLFGHGHLVTEKKNKNFFTKSGLPGQMWTQDPEYEACSVENRNYACFSAYIVKLF